MFWKLAKEAFVEMREHPALVAAIVMRPMGYRWDHERHRWEAR